MGWAINRLRLLVESSRGFILRRLAIAFRNAIIGSLPFALDLDTALRRRPAKTMIRAWQGILTLFSQDLHSDGRFLVGRRVRDFIGIAAGKPVHGTFRRIHWKVKFLALNTVGHQRSHAHLAVTSNELDPN